MPSWLPRGQTLPNDLWVRRHHGVLVLLWMHVVVIPTYAVIRGFGWPHGLLEGSVVAAGAVVASLPGIPRRERTLAAVLGLLSASAVLVHLSGGLIEMHFHFFVMVVIASLYQDWLPFLAAIGYVLLHHGVMGTLSPRSVYNHPAAWANPWKWAGIHALFIMGTSAASLVAWRLNENLLDRQRNTEDKLREETHVVESLRSVGATLAAELDLKLVVQHVTDAATKLSTAAFGAFFYTVADESGESFLLYTLSGVSQEAFAQFPLPRNTDIFRPTFKGERVVRLDDVTADSRYGNNPPYSGMPPGHLPVRSYLAVPVASRSGEVIGGLFFGHPEVGRFTAVHERLVIGIAAQAAVAIDNARLYESERRLRVATQSAGARLRLLADVSRVLTESLETEPILQGVARLLSPAFADYCVVDLLNQDGSVRRVACSFDARFQAIGEEIRRHSPDPAIESHPISEAMRTGTSRFMGTISDSLIQSLTRERQYQEIWRENKPTSIAMCPMKGRGGVIGCLWIGMFEASDRVFTADDLPLVEEVAARASIAVENAELYRRQRTVAETLQHSLLPERLPDVPGVQGAARYVSGGPGVDVGGDWYDVVQLSGGALALAMGDVVGRGERAASLMGQLRNAARAYAMEGKAPTEVVELLNRLLLELGADLMATMIFGIVDPETGTFRFVNAGHPPPLVIGPADGSAAFLEGESGVPLGATRGGLYAETVTSLVPGATLILYTDGLVEDRDTPLDVGLELLRRTVVTAPQDLEAMCDRVLTSCLKDRGADDDIALLAFRLVPLGDRLDLTLPRDPSVLAPLRATLRRWLAAGGATEQETFEIIVAAGEACSNAVQHAVGPADSVFDFSGRLDDSITIQVRDRGTWRKPREGTGGLGLAIMRSFMDTVAVDTSDEGTLVTMARRLRLFQSEGASH